MLATIYGQKSQECLLIALPIAQAQRTLMDHLSPITPLAPIASSQTQITSVKQHSKNSKAIT